MGRRRKCHDGDVSTHGPTRMGGEGMADTGAVASRKRRRRSTLAFAHKNRRGEYDGRAYVVSESGSGVVMDLAAAAWHAGEVEGDLGAVGREVGRSESVGWAHVKRGSVPDNNDGDEAETPEVPNGQASQPNASFVPDSYPDKHNTWPKRREQARDAVLVSTLALGPSTTLPSDDLLLSLHAHAARFYAQNGRLACPRPRVRAEVYENKRLKEVYRAEVAEARAWDKEHGRPGRPRKGKERKRVQQTEEPVDEEEKRMIAATKAYDADREKPEYRKIKRVDMHTALEGSALLALGVLVEEIVAHELRSAGYVPRHREEDE